ncbi:helix-turn-helix domain-containing protein [Nocardia neocaledoniensis]|uniref:helix-turn-helix domain-containing protein n=1 Tax=Nocardia neocaledoniensis TaxID=236511 RepID=UPI0024545CBF|nr:helix-turn-helix transcriptional regulator [Nocardia neocaledoniensis]
MTETPPPDPFEADRQMLGSRLRQLRKAAGHNGRDFAARLDWNASKVSRIEQGKQLLTELEIRQWCALADAHRHEVDLIAALRNIDAAQHQRSRIRARVRNAAPVDAARVAVLEAHLATGPAVASNSRCAVVSRSRAAAIFTASPPFCAFVSRPRAADKRRSAAFCWEWISVSRASATVLSAVLTATRFRLSACSWSAASISASTSGTPV